MMPRLYRLAFRRTYGSINFGLRLADMESFITFLLQMAASTKQPNPTEDRVRYQPIPISGISAGALADGMGCLGVTIGGTELMFQVPTAAIPRWRARFCWSAPMSIRSGQAERDP
jgi:hypothetical protein